MLVRCVDFVSGSNSRNRFNGHSMKQVARSTCISSPSLFKYIWVLIKDYTTVWWPTSRFMMARTNYTSEMSRVTFFKL